jgi:hypothetical protein
MNKYDLWGKSEKYKFEEKKTTPTQKGNVIHPLGKKRKTVNLEKKEQTQNQKSRKPSELKKEKTLD